MAHPPVIILAAGRGTRFGHQAETLHKALFPIQAKPVINYILERFKNHPIIIAVGHLGDQLEEYLQVLSPRNSVKFVRVSNCSGPGSGPGTSLLACRQNVSGPFYTVACDTIVSDSIPAIDRNWIGVSLVKNPARFCTVRTLSTGRVDEIADKSHDTSNRLAYIGLAGIIDTALFWEALEQNEALVANERQVSNGLIALLKKGLFAHPFDWHDTGTPESLDATRKHFGEALCAINVS